MLAIIYAVQAAAGIFFAIGLSHFIIGSSLSFRSLEAGNSVSIGGVVLLIVGVLAFIASGVFYFVLMARDSNPEGARFARSYDLQRMGSRHGRGSGRPVCGAGHLVRQRPAADQSGGCGTGRAVHGTSDSGRFVHSSGTAV